MKHKICDCVVDLHAVFLDRIPQRLVFDTHAKGRMMGVLALIENALHYA